MMWRRVWIVILVGLVAALGWREYGVRWGDWTFRSPQGGAAMLTRAHGGDRTTWSLIFDGWKDYPVQIAASGADRRGRGREMWRGASNLRLCVARPDGGVRVRTVRVTTDIGPREVNIDAQGCT